MADRAIQDLTEATSVNATDAFVLEQGGEAKQLTGQTLVNHLLKMIDGHGGITGITKRSTSGLKDTYRMTFADESYFDFVVTNGRGISTIKKTGTNGVVDTYTITLTDGTSSTFTVTNGTDIESLALVSQDGLVDTYEFTMTDGDTFEFSVRNGEKGDPGDATYTWVKFSADAPTEEYHVIGDLPDAWMGIYVGALSEAPEDWREYRWIKVKGETGDQGVSASLESSEITYQASDSGTVVPYGEWTAAIPQAAQGKYIWTRVVQQFNTGSPITFYSVSRLGVDGTGSVVSVNNISPDGNGNITIGADAVGAMPITGGTMQGSINMNGQPIKNLNPPQDDADPVTLGYTKDKFLQYRGALGADDDMDNVLTDGTNVYATSTRPANSPFDSAGVTMSFGAASTTTQRLQMGFRYARTGRGKFRALYNGSWLPWAEFAGYIEDTDHPGCYYRLDDSNNKYWVVPPMMPGVEYPLFKRYKGKVVYAILVDLGALPSTGTSSKSANLGVQYSSDATEVVSANIILNKGNNNYPVPFYNSSGTMVARGYATFAKVNVDVWTDLSAYTGKAIVEFVK